MSDQKQGPSAGDPQVPCSNCAALRGPDRGRGLAPHANLMRVEGEHLTRHGYKCTDCGAEHFHNSVSKTWY